MKETKKFFVRENKLNRGYTSETDGDLRDKNLDELIDVLPPIDVIAQYEEMHPGFVGSIAQYLENEQKHRHKLELQAKEDAKAAASQSKRMRLFTVLIGCATLVPLSIFISGWVIDIIVLVLAITVIRQFFDNFNCVSKVKGLFDRKPKEHHRKPQHDRNRRGSRGGRSHHHKPSSQSSNQSSNQASNSAGKRRGGRTRRRIS